MFVTIYHCELNCLFLLFLQHHFDFFFNGNGMPVHLIFVIYFFHRHSYLSRFHYERRAGNLCHKELNQMHV